jgi:hypothetical protein
MSCDPRTGFAEMLNQETGHARFLFSRYIKEQEVLSPR